MAAIRLDRNGRVDALAAGGLKPFRCRSLTIELPERIDLAFWRDQPGKFRGVLQDWIGPIPDSLISITDDWLRLTLPQPRETLP